MGKDYYKILGVSKDADEDACRKAYKKLALKHHPDRGGDPDKFKDLGEAVEVLTDKDKRHIYDLGGEEALKGGPPPGGAGGAGPGGNPFAGFGKGGAGGPSFSFSSSSGFPGGGGGGFTATDPNDIFASLFGGMPGGSKRRGGGMPSGFSSFGGGPGMAMDDSDDDMGIPGAFGGMPRQSAPPPQPDVQPSELVKPLPCSLEDLYRGVTKKMKVTRKLLNGSEDPKVMSIDIKPGWKSGTKLRYKQAGHEEKKGGRRLTQTLVFVIEEKPHDRFLREGDNLIYRLKVPLVEALTGPEASSMTPNKKSIPTLDGRTITYQVPYPPSSSGGAPLHPGQEIVIKGEGMPKKGGLKGDLIVRVQVEFPKTLSAQQSQSLRRSLTGA